MTFEEARSLFPVLESVAYLNAGTFGPLARPVAETLEAGVERDLEHGRTGRASFEETLGLRQELRSEGTEAIRVCTVMPMAHTTPFFEHAGNYTGRETVPIPPAYDPQVTIDALVRLVVKPEDEVITGRQGTVANILHHLLPGAVERLMAANVEKVQLADAPPAPATAGNVHAPTGS